MRSPKEVDLFHQRGSLFENLVITEIVKNRLNQFLPVNPYFWQDSNGVEIDLLLVEGSLTDLYEVKYNQSPQADFFKNIRSFRKVAPAHRAAGLNAVIYGGDQKQQRTEGTFFGWQDLGNL